MNNKSEEPTLKSEQVGVENNQTFEKTLLTPSAADQNYVTSSLIKRAKTDPRSLTPANVLALQRTIGNKAVQRLLSNSKPKKLPEIASTTQTLTNSVNTVQRDFIISLKGSQASGGGSVPRGLTTANSAQIVDASATNLAEYKSTKSTKFRQNSRSIGTKTMEDLPKIGLNEKLYIIGHGVDLENLGEASKTVGGVTPEDLAAEVGRRLPKGYNGLIYLNGCNSGAGEVSFAHQFKSELSIKFGINVRVKANKGVTNITKQFGTRVSQYTSENHSQVQKYFSTKKEIETKIDKLTKEHDAIIILTTEQIMANPKTITEKFTENTTNQQQKNKIKSEIDELNAKIEALRNEIFPKKKHTIKLEPSASGTTATSSTPAPTRIVKEEAPSSASSFATSSTLEPSSSSANAVPSITAPSIKPTSKPKKPDVESIAKNESSSVKDFLKILVEHWEKDLSAHKLSEYIHKSGKKKLLKEDASKILIYWEQYFKLGVSMPLTVKERLESIAGGKD